MNRTILFIGLTGLLIATTANAFGAPNLIKNGSFEDGLNPSTNYRSLYTGDTSLYNWDIVGRVDWSSRFGNPNWVEDGNLSAQVVGNGSSSSLSQTFSTKSSSAFKLTFFVAPQQGFQPLPLQVDFINGGTTQEFLVTFANSLPTFTKYTFEFHSSAGTTESTLAFLEQTHNGPFIDNVSVSQISTSTPSPAAALPFLLGLLRKRRTKKG